MSYRPTRVQAIRMIDDLLRVLKRDGAEATRLARDLARATGLPARTLGDGGSRGTGSDDSTSSAAMRILERGADRYEDADVKLDELMARVAVEAEVLRLYVVDLVSHAVAEEEHEGAGYVRPSKAGQGACIGCDRPVPDPDRPDDRLRGGACASCVMAWSRHRDQNPQADRVMFMRHRPAYDARPPDTEVLDPEFATSGGSAKVVEATRWNQGEIMAVEVCDRCGSVTPEIGPTGCPGSFHRQDRT